MQTGAKRALWITVSLAALIALFAFVGCKDSKLADDLEWMNNTYNPHTGVSMAYGHGRSGWYIRGSNGGDEKLSSGTIDFFKNDGCSFELHIDDDPAGSVNNEVLHSMILKFNLRDIDPDSVKVKTFSHYGGMRCEDYTPEQIESIHLNCDYAEMTAFTRNAKPLVQEESRTTFLTLIGEQHETSSSDKGTEVFLGINDPEYAKKFAGVFQDAVKRCGGTKGAAN
jgi:hypothetical protein